MLKGLHIDIPQTEENYELFRTKIDWDKEEKRLIKEAKLKKTEKKEKSILHRVLFPE